MADNYAIEKADEEEAQVGQQVRRRPHRRQMSTSTYIKTRFSTLKPPLNKSPNPFKLLALLNRRQWAFFFVGFIAWACSPLPSTSKVINAANL